MYGQRLRDLHHELHRMFSRVLQQARVGISANDLIRIIVRHDNLNHTIVVPLMAADIMSVAIIMEKVQSVSQSADELIINDSLEGKWIYLRIITSFLFFIIYIL